MRVQARLPRSSILACWWLDQAFKGLGPQAHMDAATKQTAAAQAAAREENRKAVDRVLRKAGEPGIATEVQWQVKATGPQGAAQGPAVNDAEWMQGQMDVGVLRVKQSTNTDAAMGATWPGQIKAAIVTVTRKDGALYGHDLPLPEHAPDSFRTWWPWTAQYDPKQVWTTLRREYAGSGQQAFSEEGLVQAAAKDWGSKHKRTHCGDPTCVRCPMDAKAKEAAKPPIPEGVYYNPDHDNFYSAIRCEGRGTEFYATWVSRQAEFPRAWRY